MKFSQEDWLAKASREGGIIAGFEWGLRPEHLETTDELFFERVTCAWNLWRALAPYVEILEDEMNDV